MSHPHITFHPIGRTCNLVFQAAACIGYAKKHNTTWGVPSDTREVPHFHKMFPNLPRADGAYKRYQEHPNEMCKIHGTHYDLCHFDYHEIPHQPNPIKLLGFFQSYKYFEHAMPEVKQAFKLDFIPGYEDYVSVHVRRGDYVQHAGSFPPITEDYIFKAITVIRAIDSERGNREKKIMWFSDDKPWCEELLRRIPGGHKMAHGNEFEDLSLMASCRHHIIANSSFSYWGAMLGHNPDRVVISPSHKRGQWFGMDSGVKKDCVDLLPPEWIQIEFR